MFGSDNQDNLLGQEINFLANTMNFNVDDSLQYPSSEYLTVNQFKSLDNANENLSIMHLNIRSLNHNFDNLKQLIDNPLQSTFSVIGLTETWLTKSSSAHYALPGYKLIENSRNNRTGGGVAFYIKENIVYTIHNGLSSMNEHIESLLVEINISGTRNILIMVIYRPPNSNSKQFLEHIQDLTHNPIFNNKECFIVGDFNIDISKCHSQKNPQELLDTMLSASFLPLVTKPTRVTNHSATLIDNIFCNMSPLPESGIVLSDISDHYPVFTIVQRTPKTIKIPMQSFRKITPTNTAKLKDDLKTLDWSEVYDSQDTNSSYNIFTQILISHLDKHIPLVKSKSSNYKKVPRLPWISKSLLRSINRKNNLYYTDKLKRTDQSHRAYTRYKNTLTKTLRAEKIKYFKDKIFCFKNDIKNTWKIINSAINKNDGKEHISKIKHNNISIDDDTQIATTFNNYFSQIGKNLADTIPPTDKQFHEFLKNPNSSSFCFRPVLKKEIIDIVANLKDKRSAGHDGIDNILLKGVINVIVEPLVHIFNLSLTKGIVPNGMKISKVVPIFKKGEKESVSNYRPISLLTSLSKLLEKIVYLRLLEFLNIHNIISNSQFGFRQKHSTSHAFLTFIEKVAKALDKSQHTVGVFLDLSKAFDTIDHNILLHKLHNYGIRGKALEWFRSYLKNRKQFVAINGCCSSQQNVDCGVPQGSLLGPLLFILYINDIEHCSKTLSFVLFADDSNIFLSHSDPDILAHTLVSELTNLLTWIRANKLSLNLQKTKCMLFSNSLDTLPIDITLEDTVLEIVSTTTFLGLTIDNKLTWKPHIDSICRTISRNIGVINKVKCYFPSSTLLMLYSSLILPYLNYGIIAWGHTYSTYLDRILLLQKKALRIICHTSWRAHTDVLFFDNNVLKICDLYRYYLGQFMYKLENKILPYIFYDMFKKNQSFHNYPTRHSNEYHLPLTRTILTHSIFTSAGPTFWNTLENSIKSASTITSFKAKLKTFLLSSYKPVHQGPIASCL